MKQEITFTNWVKMGDKYIPFKELSKEQQCELGNQLKRRPLEALGYTVQMVETG